MDLDLRIGIHRYCGMCCGLGLGVVRIERVSDGYMRTLFPPSGFRRDRDQYKYNLHTLPCPPRHNTGTPPPADTPTTPQQTATAEHVPPHHCTQSEERGTGAHHGQARGSWIDVRDDVRRLATRFAGLEQRFDGLEERMDESDGRIDAWFDTIKEWTNGLNEWTAGVAETPPTITAQLAEIKRGAGPGEKGNR
ncbi:hypothetical protein C7212DRAFT_361388 [Tuber magnatum]|uniref:Uncharacterized protein n=1 Tax=Tuber magnatum TaxID=42249 RepID=A0A317T397_9PEZI|nr:hypothetical protein C7212DRAFT_361388 [Tuber magnatum]